MQAPVRCGKTNIMSTLIMKKKKKVRVNKKRLAILLLGLIAIITFIIALPAIDKWLFVNITEPIIIEPIVAIGNLLLAPFGYTMY